MGPGIWGDDYSPFETEKKQPSNKENGMNTGLRREKSPLAGKTVKLRGVFKDHMGGEHTELQVEDWVENVMGGPWGNQQGNPACLNYAVRTGTGGTMGGVDVPTFGNDVVYGKTGKFGNLFHVNELDIEASEKKTTT